jgi:hypothetical protein
MGITPVKNGFVQTVYADFMGQATNGMLANSSDINLCDSVYTGDIKGYAGRCYGLKAGKIVSYADGLEPVVCVFHQQMNSDDEGNYDEGTCTVLRSKRIGGRIFVEVSGISEITEDTTLSVDSDGKFTTGSGTSLAEHVKVVGEYSPVDSKALVEIEVF